MVRACARWSIAREFRKLRKQGNGVLVMLPDSLYISGGRVRYLCPPY